MSLRWAAVGAIFIMARAHHSQAHLTPARSTGLETGQLPNLHAIMNGRINYMEPEQYPRFSHGFVMKPPLIGA
jgi:hypothetical protein